MAALDYARLRERLPRSRLLFVAHREEILDQSLATFRYALRDPSFGEKWVGGARPTRLRARLRLDPEPQRRRTSRTSPPITSTSSSSTSSTTPRPRRTTRVLDHLAAGRAARPHRHAGAQRRAADPALVRRPHRRRAAPVGCDRPAAPRRRSSYFGIHDGLDLRGHPVAARPGLRRRGAQRHLHQHRRLGPARGASRSASTSTTGRDARARLLRERRARPVHGRVTSRGTASRAVAVWGDSPEAEREAALRDLAGGERARRLLRRPLQRGRRRSRRRHGPHAASDREPDAVPPAARPRAAQGARTSRSAPCSTSSALTARSSASTAASARCSAASGATSSGRRSASSRSFRPVATWSSTRRRREIVLRSFARGDPVSLAGEGRRAAIAAAGAPGLDLAGFLDESGLDLEDVYDGRQVLVRPPQAAGAPVLPAGPAARPSLRRAIGRLLHVDDDERIDAYRRLLDVACKPPDVATLPERERRLLHMLVAAARRPRASPRTPALQEAVDLALGAPAGARRAASSCSTCSTSGSITCTPALRTHPDVPLQVHARYTRIEILAAFGLCRPAPRSPPGRAASTRRRRPTPSCFAFTLDKSSGRLLPDDPLPRLRHQPHAHPLGEPVGDAADSPTGLRYRNHERDGRTILLFARLRADDRAFWFLGPATYRGHVGERPMAITWELEHPLSGDLYQSFAAAVA